MPRLGQSGTGRTQSASDAVGDVGAFHSTARGYQPARSATIPRVNVLVSGASGMIGTTLVSSLASQGHRPINLVRGRPPRDHSEIAWNPDAGSIEVGRLQGLDAVVNLAGASIARWPWNAAHKRRILESRVRSTSLLADAVAKLTPPPRVFVSASGVGYYGSRGDEILQEDSNRGAGFLAEVCTAWEAAPAEALSKARIRLARIRIGMALSGTGGALPAIALPFRLGLGGRLGNGRQYMSWIALEDLVRAIVHILENESLSGPINAVSPHPVTNAEFTRDLGSVLNRPTILPAPAFALRLLLGEMADELLLTSQRAEPARLTGSGFEFQHPKLEGALRAALR